MKNFCIQLSRKALLTLVMALCVTLPVLAQKITVSGVVSDATGEPLIGASVVVAGSPTVGVATDFDGNYRIDVDPNASLTFTYVGMEPQTIAVNGRTTIDITLKENTVVLGEVVAVGYGVVKKSDATGSVAVIKPDDIEAGIATSAQDMLVGASPGVVVTTNGGNPTGNATIRIRGGSSLSANNNPLVVIDGVPMTDQSYAGTNALSMVSPDNVESMTILKDASATAIYGSRASNGVIIITTKKGQSGKPQINFSANWHVNTARKTLNVMDGNQYRNIVNQYGSDAAKSYLGDANTDWQKEVLRTTLSQDYSLSVGGTAGWLPYRVSVSFTDNQGILKTSSMQRTTAGFNLSPKFFDGLLSINANVKGTYVANHEPDMGAIGSAVSYNPTVPVRMAYPTAGTTGLTMFNGFFNVLSGDGGIEQQAAKNPVQMLEDQKNKSEIWSSTGNLQIDYALHFLPDLHLNLNLGYQVSRNFTDTDVAANSVMAWTGQYQDGAGTHYHKYELQRNTLLDFYANYRKEVESLKSTFDIMAGYSWQRFDYFGHDATYMATRGFNRAGNLSAPIVDGKYQLEWNDATEDRIGKTYNNQPINRWAEKLQLVSYFGRFNYTLDNTYLLTFTLRDDGTSRFHKNKRWGLFPSLALGWKIDQMNFFEPITGWWNELKMRLGWGITGQQDLGGSYFPYLPVYTISQQPGMYPSPDGNGSWINPIYPQPYDEDIKWEETTTWNIGFDMAWLSNRITFSADWYLRDTKDLLAYVPIAGVSTSNYMNRNIGTLRNTGLEFNLLTRPVVTNDLTWTSAVNVGWNKNEITKLTGNKATDSPIQATTTPAGTGTGLQYHIVGEPAFTYRVYQQVYDNNGDPIPGQYVDQNGDGTIDDNDKINFHSPDPKVTISWNNNLNYKNWDFGITLRANFGNWVYNNQRYERGRIPGMYAYGLTNLLADEYLFPSVSDQLVLSDYFVENASFVRCDNITVGYTFENILKSQKNPLRLRLFGAVQNPFVITKYKGLDPEVYGGIDNNVYPRPITCTLGLVATF